MDKCSKCSDVIAIKFLKILVKETNSVLDHIGDRFKPEDPNEVNEFFHMRNAFIGFEAKVMGMFGNLYSDSMDFSGGKLPDKWEEKK